MPDPAGFFQRRFPSANAVLLGGPRPVLVDGGFGSDVADLLAWLAAQGVRPDSLALVVNTHFDCDHAGANHALMRDYGLPVAAHAIEAASVNGRDPAACRARWLHQPIEPYRVDRVLADGDVIDTGSVTWTVLHTPGHTAGHISLYSQDHAALVTGDAVHSDDLGWIDVTRPASLDEAEATVARLTALDIRVAYSGHGPATAAPAAAIAAAGRRLTGWRRAPDRMAWHGAKRVFAYDLMVDGPMTEAALYAYLPACPWFAAYAAHPFGLSPAAFVAPLVEEMLRSGAASWRQGRLTPSAAYNPPPPGWPRAPTDPTLWPR